MDEYETGDTDDAMRLWPLTLLAFVAGVVVGAGCVLAVVLT